MIIITFLFIWNFFIIAGLELTPEQKASLPGPEFAFILPGINPILPLEYIWYIVIAFVVAIVVHEFSHGILTFVSKLKVKSMGIVLFLIFPIGAFVEPDEEQIKKTTIKKRMRIFAVGPLSNFVVTFVALLLFSFVFLSAIQPIDGAEVFYTFDDTPAADINIPAGARIISFNETDIKNLEDFSNSMDLISPNQTVNVTYFVKGNKVDTQVTLMSKYEFYSNLTDEQVNTSFMNESWLGVGFTPRQYYTSALKNPFTFDFPNGFLEIFILPFIGYIEGYNPIASPFKENYEITGPLAVIPEGVFWTIVNALYWIFWLNILVGLFNTLPIGPFDGGHLFVDGIKSFIQRIKKDITEEMRDKIANNISLFVSLIVLFLVIFPFFIKYI
jgi:membrane-associated protease RseP (regulator of RpoE activity)